MTERRTCVRFAVPGATISFRTKGFLFRSFAPSDEGCPVLDLSKGGLSFLTNKSLKTGTGISLLFSSSDLKAPIALKGKIVHVSINHGISYKYRVGVQFDPFGTRKGTNPLEILKDLNALERTYAPVQSSRE